MERSGWGRMTALFSVAAFILGGCGQSSSAGAVPQGATALAREHRASGSSGDLIYAATYRAIVVVSYPQGNIVAKIPGRWFSICSDPNTGNVFASGPNNQINEYAHGGTTPVATLFGAF